MLYSVSLRAEYAPLTNDMETLLSQLETLTDRIQSLKTFDLIKSEKHRLKQYLLTVIETIDDVIATSKART